MTGARFFRLRPHGFAGGERPRIRTMIDLQNPADDGLRDAPPEQCRRLKEMRDLSTNMEKALTNSARRPERTHEEVSDHLIVLSAAILIPMALAAAIFRVRDLTG